MLTFPFDVNNSWVFILDQSASSDCQHGESQLQEMNIQKVFYILILWILILTSTWSLEAAKQLTLDLEC